MLPQTPVGRALVDGVAHILVAGAGVVDADGVTALAPQRGMHGHVGGLAKDVPQGNVHGRVAACLDARAAPAQIPHHVLVLRASMASGSFPNSLGATHSWR